MEKTYRMRKKSLVKIGLHVGVISLTMFFLLIQPLVARVDAQAVNFSISPSHITAKVGQDLAIEVEISDVLDLYGWEFRLSWDPALLVIVDVIESEFLASSSDTFFAYKIDDDLGHMVVDCTLLGMVAGISGGGTLAVLTFHAKNVGDCLLDLYGVLLLNSDELSISCEVIDATVRLEPLSDIHDVELSSVSPYRTVLDNGSATSVRSVIFNSGDFQENFDVSLFCNSSLVETITMTLQAGNSASITFNWTTPSVIGNYSVEVTVSQVLGETDIGDNALAYSPITISIKGDINADGTVNIIDISKTARAFLSTPDDSNWNPNVDMNEDGTINIIDVSITAKEFGK
jgi:hypothetical protein